MNTVKYVIFYGLIALLLSCVSDNSYHVDDVSGKRSIFLNKEISLVGFIHLERSGLLICSEQKSNRCIPIEATIEIYESLKELEGKRVNLRGKYVDHEFSEDGISFSPSRFVVLMIISSGRDQI